VSSRLLLLVVVGLILYGSLYPWHFVFDGSIDPIALLLESWPDHFERSLVRDAVLNVLLYAPLGAAAAWHCLHHRDARRRTTAAALAVAAAMSGALSVSVELLQAYDISRETSLLDVATNLAGGLSGAVLALVFRSQFDRLSLRRGRLQPHAAGVLALCWYAFQLYPFFPQVSLYRLQAWLSSMLRFTGFAAPETFVSAAGWCLAGLSLEAVLGASGGACLALAMLPLPLRIFITRQSPEMSDVLGAATAWVVWPWVRGRRSQGAPWLATAAVVVEELRPFRFTAMAQAFSWIPFASSLNANWQPAVIVLLGKFFYYGSAVWLWHAAGWSYVRAGGLIAVMLAGLEWAQRYLPGRTPEVTDPILALIAMLVLRRAGDIGKR
jgi:VanZ family protein